MVGTEQIKPMRGWQLREMREEGYRLSQSQLAFLLGVSQNTVARWERDEVPIPPYLPQAVQIVGYQQVVVRNQPILDQHVTHDLEGYRRTLAALGVTGRDGPIYELPMFDAHGHLVHWHVCERDSVYAIGEIGEKVDNDWNGYIIPMDAESKPELRLPTLMESGYQAPVLVRQLGRPRLAR